MSALQVVTAAAATAEKPSIPATEEFRVVPIELVDEPLEPERETMDEVLLAELADEIAAVGQQNPCRVREEGARYRIISGHRRLLACRLASIPTLKVIVDRDNSVSDLAKMLSENSGREDPNPVERARVYARALTELCGNDVDRLCELVKKPRAHVEDRLVLLAGDEQVLAALHHRHISLAVARELNRVDDADRRLVFLDAAVRGGATARQVQEWRVKAQFLPPTPLPPPDTTGTDGQAQHIAPTNGFVCLFCGDGDDVHLMELLYLHRQCKKFLNRFLQREPQATPAQES